jgi:hypothetical protein
MACFHSTRTDDASLDWSFCSADEKKEYNSLDRDQKRLTGFFTSADPAEEKQMVDSVMDDDDSPVAAAAAAAASSSVAAAMESAIDDDEELGLFFKPAPNSASKRDKDESPAKRQKTNLLSLVSKTSSAVSASSASDGFPELEDPDDPDTYDLTLTPVTARSSATTVGVSASSVRSPATSSIGRSPTVSAASHFARRKPTMITANSPSMTINGNSSSPSIEKATPTKARTSTSPNTKMHTEDELTWHAPSPRVSPHASPKKVRDTARDMALLLV